MPHSFDAIRTMPPSAARDAIRAGHWARHTAGLAAGYLQANVVIVGENDALDFLRFCQRNARACPLVGVTETGDPCLRTLGSNIDLRTDLPSYNIYEDGRLARQAEHIEDLWTEHMVGFALGCSFTFEGALLQAGIPVRHIEENRTVPMYLTNRPLVPAGPFKGELVVSMRPILEDRVEEVTDICRRYPLAHGAPIHVGDPAALGIENLAYPDWGQPSSIRAGEVPVFWACGVTPQRALAGAGLPLAITHTPGHMLITDVPEDAEDPVLKPDETSTSGN